MNAPRRNKLADIHADVPVLDERHLEPPRKNLQAMGEIIPGKADKKIGQLFRMPDLEGKTCRIPIEWLTPDPNQMRQYKDFADADEEDIEEDDGQIDPIMVVPYRDGNDIRFLIVDGEMRWRRAKKQKNATIVAQVIWKPTMAEIHEIALLKKVDQRDLNPIEKAREYRRVMDYYITAGLASDEVRARERLAKRMHRKSGAILPYLKLLELHETLQGAIGVGILSGDQGRRMLEGELRTQEAQELLAQKIVAETTDTPEPLAARTVDRIMREVRAEINVARGNGTGEGGKVKIPRPPRPRKPAEVEQPTRAEGSKRERTVMPSFAPGKPGSIEDICSVTAERAHALVSSLDQLLEVMEQDERGTYLPKVRAFLKRGLGQTLQDVREAIRTVREMVK